MLADNKKSTYKLSAGKPESPVKRKERVGYHGAGERGRIMEEELPLGYWFIDW